MAQGHKIDRGSIINYLNISFILLIQLKILQHTAAQKKPSAVS